jgi:hypothetical protein
MTEVAAVVPEKESKTWVEEYQFKDPETGSPIGPPQRFEAPTQKELIKKLIAAHENASVALYKTRKAVKLGTMLEPDPDEPLQTFEPKTLSADERIKVTKMLGDPSTVVEGYRLLSEATYGASPEVVRESLQDREVQKRVGNIQNAIAQFKSETPEYVESQGNADTLKKYMEKKNLRYTAKNLKIAFEDLVNDGLLVVRAPKAEVPAPPAPVTPAAVAPPVSQEIPGTPTIPAPVIPSEPTEVRPKQSSSGLGRDNSSAVPGAVPAKAVGITVRDINRMTAAQYQEALKDPEFKKQVDALYAKK